MPGYTHLQRAIPVTLGHHLLAWVEMLERDRARFAFAAAQAAPSPLGAGALAGSTLPLPPPPDAMRNSIDAVADRDFALDYLYAAAVLFTHLSRIGEELVLWTTSEFGFARLPEDAATGSSMMPQKLNADVAELARGKAGTAIGRLTGLLATVKGLPLAYNRDLQEDKPPVFAARADVAGALGALAVLVRGLAFDRDRLAAACADPLLRATDAAEALVREGVPFRDAHEQVAAQRSRRKLRAPPARRRTRLGDVGAAVAAAKERWAMSPAPSALGRDLLRITDLVPPGDRPRSSTWPTSSRPTPRAPLPGRTLGLFFGQPSTRTRISFSVAIAQLGGTPITLLPDEMQLSRGESLEDTAQVLSRYVDALAIRTLSHDELEAWAEACTIPVINALTEVEHPCQALADALTIRERLGGARRRPDRLGRRRDERPRLARAPRARLRRRRDRRLPGGLRPAGRHAARADARPARGRPRRRRARHGHLGLARPGGNAHRSGCATWSRTASTTRSSSSRTRRRSSSTASPRIPARRSRRRCCTARARRCGTRPRTACTCRRRCSRCCSADVPQVGTVARRVGFRRATASHSRRMLCVPLAYKRATTFSFALSALDGSSC